jgi:hypothetical protein
MLSVEDASQAKSKYIANFAKISNSVLNCKLKANPDKFSNSSKWMKIPQTPPNIESVLLDSRTDLTVMLKQGPLEKGRYLHWDQLRQRKPPEKLTLEAWWAGIKFARQALYARLALQAKDGQPVQFGMPDPVLRALHEIDSQASGSVAMPGALVSSDDRDRYLVSSLIEEAITSS